VCVRECLCNVCDYIIVTGMCVRVSECLCNVYVCVHVTCKTSHSSCCDQCSILVVSLGIMCSFLGPSVWRFTAAAAAAAADDDDDDCSDAADAPVAASVT